jgi:glutamyl-Q tRNA(Asp) synthetase
VGDVVWTDAFAGTVIADPREFGDVVIVRKDLPSSYHLAVTLDDAVDGVTLVTRGADLFTATHIHRVLQALLGLPVPDWHHHPLILDESGEKLAKRRGSPPLSQRREAGEDGLMLAEQLRLQKFRVGT